MKGDNKLRIALKALYAIRSDDENVFYEFGEKLISDILRDRVRRMQGYEFGKEKIYEYIFIASFYKNKGSIKEVKR